MNDYGLFAKLGLALAIGLIIGLQRERTESRLGGFRTYPLIAIYGAVMAFLAPTFGGWIPAFGALALAVVILSSNVSSPEAKAAHPGITSEVTMLLTYGLGAMVMIGPPTLAITVAGATAVLLHLKPQMHSFARKIGPDEFRAVVVFILISLVVLPVLPNRAFGPYDVLNPFKIWMLVVLIVGISLGGYVANRLFGERAGSLLGGLFGGLISSTATTASFARRSRSVPGTTDLALTVIMMATAISYGRVILLLLVAAPDAAAMTIPPLAILFVAMLSLSLLLWLTTRHVNAEMPPQANPAELGSAILFALIFAVVLLATAAAKEHFGSRGLLAVGVLSGLTDMDAITLSTAELMRSNRVTAVGGWQVILLASMSNLVAKAVIAFALGGRELGRRVALLFGLVFAVGAAVLRFYPNG